MENLPMGFWDKGNYQWTLDEHGRSTLGLKRIQNGSVYALRGYWRGKYTGYISSDANSGWCRQIYDDSNSTDTGSQRSQFKFMVHDSDLDQWTIMNVYPGKRKDTWLSYGKCKERDGKSVGLFKKQSDAAIWTLIPTDKPMYYKIKCYYRDAFKGWLSYQYDGKWNMLYKKESDACVYFLKDL